MTTVTREHPGLDAGRTPESFHLQILGPLRVWRDGIEVDAGSRLQRCLLALLLARGGNPVSMSEIVDLLWGVGKTVLALRLAHEFASAYPDGQLHLDLRGFAEVDRPVTAEEALHDLISGLGVEQWHIPDGRQAMAGLYRTLLRNRRVLVVLDDARSIDQVVDLLPSSAGCLVFLTSRRRMPALRTAAGAYLVPVGLPAHDEARAQLARHFGARWHVLARAYAAGLPTPDRRRPHANLCRPSTANAMIGVHSKIAPGGDVPRGCSRR